jgi:hypothetical protein
VSIGAMFEREMKQEKNLELRERDLRRARAVEAETKVFVTTILYHYIILYTYNI